MDRAEPHADELGAPELGAGFEVSADLLLDGILAIATDAKLDLVDQVTRAE